jgi:hypothetical protein
MPVLKDRVRVVTATIGAGILTLGPAVDGYRTPAEAGLADGATIRYVIEDNDDWEINTGVLGAGGTTLTRIVGESSNDDDPVDLSGDAEVFITAVADDLVPYDGLDATLSETGKLKFGSDAILQRDAAGILAQRNGVSAQALRVYNTFTNAANYERGAVQWATNVFRIDTEAAGTGTQRAFVINAASIQFHVAATQRWQISGSGHFIAAADNTYDIGASGANRPRNVYVAGSIGAANASVSDYFSASRYLFTGKGAVNAPTDGVIRIANAADNDFNRLQFGGTTSSFPALKRSGTELHARLADDSAYAVVLGHRFEANHFRTFQITTNEVAINYHNFGVQMGSAATLAWGSSGAGTPDTILARDAAGVLAQRNGTNAQALRIYNTYTDASNYERAVLEWGSNSLLIGTQMAGTGSARNIRFVRGGVTFMEFGSSVVITPAGASSYAFNSSGHLIASTDNAVDIGASGANRPRDLHLGRRLVMAEYLEISEMTAPAAPAANKARLYVDDSAGQTRVMARFSSGDPVQIAPTTGGGGGMTHGQVLALALGTRTL